MLIAICGYGLENFIARKTAVSSQLVNDESGTQHLNLDYVAYQR